MTNLSIMDDVADAITRLRYLEKKSTDDVALIELMTRQKDELAQELADAKHNFGIDMFQMQQERDAAIKKAADVQAIIETLGTLALSGIKRIRDPEIQSPETEPPLIVKHLQNAPKPLEPMSKEMETRLPRPEFNSDDVPLFLRGRDGKKIIPGER